jgi:hypothetical protein
MNLRFPAILALVLLAALTPLPLEAETVTGNPNPPPAPPRISPAAPDYMRKLLLKMAHRLVEVQQQTPDDKIKAIIDQCHLNDVNFLNGLSADESKKRVIAIAIALYQASSTDPLAVQLMKEFQITYTPKAPAK